MVSVVECSGRRTLPQVVEVQETIVAAAKQRVRILVVVLARYQRRRGAQLGERHISLVDVPNKRRHGHLVRHPLESEVGVRAHNFCGALGVPADLRDAALLVCRVLEERDGLHAEALRQVLRLLLMEVVLEEIDGAVHLEAGDRVLGELLHSGHETRIFFQTLPPLERLLRLLVVNLLGPAAFNVNHRP